MRCLCRRDIEDEIPFRLVFRNKGSTQIMHALFIFLLRGTVYICSQLDDNVLRLHLRLKSLYSRDSAHLFGVIHTEVLVSITGPINDQMHQMHQIRSHEFKDQSNEIMPYEIPVIEASRKFDGILLIKMDDRSINTIILEFSIHFCTAQKKLISFQSAMH
jgi:hypothetical protein